MARARPLIVGTALLLDGGSARARGLPVRRTTRSPIPSSPDAATSC